LVISRPQVYFREHYSSPQLIQQIVNSRQWVLILHDQFIQLTIVNTQPWTIVLLLYQEYRCSPRWCTIGFTNKCLSLGMIQRYHTTFKAGPFFSNLPLSSLLIFSLYHDKSHFGYFFNPSNYILYNMQSLGQTCILLYSLPFGQIIFFAS